MSGKKIEIGDVFNWFTSAIELAMKNPGVFIVMALIYAVISAIPLLNLAMIVVGPALQGGFVWAAREEDQGRKADISHLFNAFQQPGKAGPMITLCLPTLALALVAGVLIAVMIGGALFAASSGSSSGAGFGFIGMAIAALLMIPAAIAVAFMTYFAVPRVMLDNVAPFDAIKESFAICMSNLVSIVVGFLCVGIAFVVLALLIGWIPLIGALALGILGALIGGPSMYFAHRQVFGVSEPAQPPVAPPAPMSPPADPPAPPAPPPAE
ncbi:MAG TPA: BPSS1780 family membrane protein [Patescibacteria group bacterium]|nr:BPSS1780 family membrane protein [Patescibacteria group bacterium]